MRVLAIDGSPTGGGRTRTVLQAVLAAATISGAEAAECSLAGDPENLERTLSDMAGADAFVIGSPIYRASFATPLKALLDRVPRDLWGEIGAPLQGKAVVVVATGASLHHFLALNDFRNVLAGFFAAHVVPPGLYVPRDGFAEDGSLAPTYAHLAMLQGQALVEMATALQQSTALRLLTPQA